MKLLKYLRSLNFFYAVVELSSSVNSDSVELSFNHCDLMCVSVCLLQKLENSRGRCAFIARQLSRVELVCPIISEHMQKDKGWRYSKELVSSVTNASITRLQCRKLVDDLKLQESRHIFTCSHPECLQPMSCAGVF